MLKFYGLMMAILVLGTGAGTASALPAMEHDLTVRLRPSDHLLEVVDVVTVSTAGAPTLVLELAGHLDLASVQVDGRNSRFSFKKGRLRIPLPKTPDRLSLRIEYGGRFNDSVTPEPLNTDNPGFGVTGTITDRGTMLLAGAKWYPRSEDIPSVYNLTVDAPEGILAVTAGRPLGHTTEEGRSLSRWRVDNPLRGIPLVAGPYIVATRKFGPVTAATYFSSSVQHLSESYLSATGRYLRLYQGLFGPYPFAQFAVVDNFFPTGYGFPSFTLLGRRVLQLPFIIHTSLGHEIAHCWWGNGVLVDASQGNWSEGLTTYVADYLYRERRGEGRSHRLQWLRNYADLVTGSKDFPVAGFMGRVDPATRAVGYDKTAMVFHMLRQTVGEDLFWSALRDIYAGNLFKEVSWADLQQAFEARSRMALGGFFKQWVRRPGAPVLALSKVTATRTADGYIVSGAVLQEKPYYNLRLDLVLSTDRPSVSRKLTLTGPKTPFSFTVSSLPKQLTADPDVHLFRRLAAQELPSTINTVKGAASVTVVVAEHLGAAGMEMARRLTVAMGLGNARIQKEGHFSRKGDKDHDLLFVGIPADKTWLPAGNDQFSLASGAATVNGQVYSTDKTSFFGVFDHPGGDGTSALFIPVDPDVGNRLVTKIPHYGKYSYLVFKNTRNHTKGTWAPANSPMVVRWPLDPNRLAGETR